MAVSGVGGGGGGGSVGAVRAGKAFVEISANDDLLTRGLHAAERKLHAWGKTVRNIGLGISGVGGVVLAPITAAFGEMLSHFSDVQKAAGRLFTTPEVASGLGYALGGLEEMEHAARHLQRSIAENDESFAKLGLSAAKLKGLDLEEQFLAVGDALDKVEDPTKKVQIAFGLLGREGAALASKLTGAGLREKIGRAGLVGEVVSSEDAANAARVGKLFSDLGKAVKNTWREVGASLLAGTDVFALYADKVLLGIKAVRDWLHEHRALVLTVALAAAGVVALGAAVTGLGVGMQAASFAIAGVLKAAGLVVPAFTALAAVITSPGFLMAAAFAALAAVIASVSVDFAALAATAVGAGEAIAHALQAGRIDLAWKVTIAGLDLEWKRFLAGFHATFIEAWYDIVYVVRQLWSDLFVWLQKRAVDAINALGATGINIVGSLVPGGLPAGLAEQIAAGFAAADQVKAGIDKAAAEADVERTKQYAADKERRAAARKAVVDAAQAEFEKARAGAAAVPIPGVEPKRPPVPGVGLELGTAAGAFSSGDFRQLLGGGKVEQQQLDELKGISGRLQAGFEVLREVKDTLKLGTGGFF
jgi:hypothetical protein